MCKPSTLLLLLSLTLSLLALFVASEPLKESWARKRRQAVPPARALKSPNKAYQLCIAPNGRTGHCKHLSNCFDTAYRYNFAQMMDYMCVIEKEFVGVCCPDEENSEWRNEVLPTRGLANSLPSIAIDGDETEEGGEAAGSGRGVARGCGVSSRDQSRVTGGRPTSSREWPWVAAILRNGEQYCGGVLVTDRHVLTAAHCVHRLKPRELRVRLGEYDLRFPNETRALDFKVVEIRLHRGYVPTTYKHDIALVKIHRPTIFNTYIWPICLPPFGATLENKQATVIGWGTTSYAGAGSYILREVNIPIWPQGLCAAKFTQEITSEHICAGAVDGNGDACQGDSGGPLMHQLSNGRWVSVGIVSWGIGCGVPGRPGIYTRVSSYLDWIFANAVF